jgi:hypothetical protein
LDNEGLKKLLLIYAILNRYSIVCPATALYPGDGPSAYFSRLCQARTGFVDGIVIESQ